MGLLIPEDLPLGKLDKTERRVVQKLVSGLRDSWLVIPRVDIVADNRPFEIDVLLVSERFGMLAIEVKGGRIEVREGEWYRGGRTFRSPTRQAQDAAYALRKVLRADSALLKKVHVQHAVALPDVSTLTGHPGGFFAPPPVPHLRPRGAGRPRP